MSKLKAAFFSQRCAAAKRGIEFLLSFEEWLTIWHQSGKLEKRGRGSGKYCMSRPGDKGPYAPWNIKIILHEQNLSEGNKGRIFSSIHRKRLRAAAKLDTHFTLPKGYKFSASRNKKISEKLKGKPKSAAHRLALSRAAKICIAKRERHPNGQVK